MKKLVVPLTIVFIAAPIEASACHIYTKWHFPWRQRCLTAARPATTVKVENAKTSRERIEIPVPELDWTPCPPADERWTGIAKLRAMEDVPPVGRR